VTVTVSAAANLGLELWSTTATSVWTGIRGRLASSAGGAARKTVSWANRGRSARVVYANVRTTGRPVHFTAAYALRVGVTRLP
jgi:hypothetical protein